MAAPLTLRALLRSGLKPVLDAYAVTCPEPFALRDPLGNLVYGSGNSAELPLGHLGTLAAPDSHAAAISQLTLAWSAKELERRSLASEVLHLYREVNLFEQLSTGLATVLDGETVSETALAQARRLIPATAGAVFLGTTSSASFGDTAGLEPVAAETLARGTADLGDTFLAAPLLAKQVPVGAIVLQGGSYSSVELKLLNTIALQTGVAIENVRALRDREQLAAIRQELDTARTIQHSLVPSQFPPFPGRTEFDLHASMTSAKAVGGDFFDFFLIGENRLGIVLGDVSGKGVPSALFMAVTRTQIKSVALQGVPPEQCMQAVNKALVRDKASSMFATCFYGILDLESGAFDYCNAGHNPPYLLAASGAVSPLPLAGGPPLGLFDLLPYASGRLELSPGDAIFLYTDGVPEATDLTDADFTDERLIAELEANAKLSCPALLEEIHRQVTAFTNGAPQSDDITMLAVRLL
jgi:serine phosphatase RsbU (regulator of sigma subunit)